MPKELIDQNPFQQEKLREIEGELEGIKEELKTVGLQDKRMTSFEKKIQEVADTQSDIIENCHQQQIKIKDQKKETEKLKTQSQQFTKDLRDVLVNVQELNTQISALEKKAFTNTQFDDLEEKVQSLEVSSRDLSVKLEEKSSSLEEITRKYGGTLKRLSSDLEKMHFLEEKIYTMEISRIENAVESEKSFRDMDTKYEMVCQVVNARVASLEGLRDIFNKNLDTRTHHITKLNNVCDQMAELLPKFSQVAASGELKSTLSRVNVMQEAMSSLNTSSKMLSEKQLAMEKLVESLSDKYSKVEQEKLKKIDVELKSIKK